VVEIPYGFGSVVLLGFDFFTDDGSSEVLAWHDVLVKVVEASCCARMSLAQALDGLETPSLTVIGDGFGTVDFSLKVGPPRYVTEGRVHYAVDMAQHAEEASPTTGCAGLWSSVGALMSARFQYAQFDDPCSTNLSVTDTYLTRSSFVVVFLLLTPTGEVNETQLAQWVIPLEIHFNRSMYIYHHVVSPSSTWLEALPPVEAGAFNSTLSFYKTHLFGKQKSLLLYHANDDAFIEHSLTSAGPSVTVKWVLLSTSRDAVDASATKHNLMDSLRVYDESPGRVRFSVTLVKCATCFLHVWSELQVAGEGRRLEQRHYAYLMEPVAVLGGSDQELVPLIAPVLVVVLSSLGTSAVFGAGVRAFLWMVTKESRFSPLSRAMFFVVEFLDVLSDVLAFRFCQAEGDLQLDDGGAIGACLAISVGLSCVLFVAELVLLRFRGVLLEKLLPWLVCFHVMGEDTCQGMLYSFIAASQAAGGMGVSQALIAALGQTALFLLVKFVAAAEPLLSDVRGGAYRAPH